MNFLFFSLGILATSIFYYVLLVYNNPKKKFTSGSGIYTAPHGAKNFNVDMSSAVRDSTRIESLHVEIKEAKRKAEAALFNESNNYDMLNERINKLSEKVSSLSPTINLNGAIPVVPVKKRPRKITNLEGNA